MVVAAGLSSLGNPQHFVVGAIVAVVVYVVAQSRRFAVPERPAFVLAVAVVIAAELAFYAVTLVNTALFVFEIVVYPLLHVPNLQFGVHYVTLAEMAIGIAGAIVGVAAVVPVRRRFSMGG